jgi:alkylhydroperoxidase family enzyme
MLNCDVLRFPFIIHNSQFTIRTMPRLSKLPAGHPDPEVRETFDAFLKERGNIPNMFRTAAHRPEIMKTMAAHLRAILNTGTVEKKLKELVAVRVSYINLCDY